jgi:hypothetical protein
MCVSRAHSFVTPEYDLAFDVLQDLEQAHSSR